MVLIVEKIRVLKNRAARRFETGWLWLPQKRTKKQDISDSHTTDQTRPRVPSGTVPDFLIKLVGRICEKSYRMPL